MNQNDTSKPKLYAAKVLKPGLEHQGKARAVGDEIEVDAATAIFLAAEKRQFIDLPAGLKTAAAAAAKAAADTPAT